MRERVTYQIGDLLQAYDGRIGRVIHTCKRTNAAFPDDQRIWIRCDNGSIMDAIAEYFKAVSSRSSRKVS